MRQRQPSLVRIIGFAWLLVALGTPAWGQKFKSDDPIWEDPDRNPIPLPKESDDLSQILDFMENTFSHRPDDVIVRSENISTIGEVPDSSWFVNRMSRKVMSIEELVRGPNSVDGPEITQTWTIIRAKTQGITPGFTIRDSRGDIYFIKFDPRENDQLATSSEVVCTKLFHAFGYNVPENYLALIKRDMVKAGEEAQVTDENGQKRKLTDKDIDRIFERVPVRSDGTVQVVASKGLPGKVVGPFKYYGTRSDDPNDIFPHENRRELRGLRVFAAWLNHDDSRSINSKDFWIGDDKLGYVKHHLIDFGSCLGSGSVRIQGRRAGNEYRLEWTPMLRSALTLGLWDRSWRYIDYPDNPAVGRYEADYFRPERWKPEYPNPAFERMLAEDAFWATRTVTRFTDEMLAAVVATGQWLDKTAEEYLLKTIIKRRDKIVAYYLSRTNPLDNFQLSDNGGKRTVTFDNLGEQAGLGQAESYEWQWFAFNNLSGSTEELSGVQITRDASIPVPAHRAQYLLLKVRTLAPKHADWKKNVHVYVRNGTGSLKIVGVERDS